MKATAMQMRKALDERLAALRVQIRAKALRAGDLVEYIDLQGGFRAGRVVRVMPRAGRLVLGALTREDLPHGSKGLADCLRVHLAYRRGDDGILRERFVRREPKRVMVRENQVVGVFVGPLGDREVARPGTDAWVTFLAARAAERGTDTRTEGAESPAESGNAAQVPERHRALRSTRRQYPVPSEMPSPAAAPNPVAAFQAELRAALEAGGGR